MKLKETGELGLLAALERFFPKSQDPAATVNRGEGFLGPGDDCAVFPLGGESGFLLLTTDTMVEGRHFLRSFSSAFQIGYKLLAVNLSDIAAMGGSPAGVLLTLQLPADLEVAWVESLYEGIESLARKHAVSVLGGDTVESDCLALGVTAFGFSKRKPVTRSGAKAGDDLWVSGMIGGGGAGLAVLREAAPRSSDPVALVERYQTPAPRLELGRMLNEEGLATAMIDVSDGLLQDSRHIAERSGKTLIIDAAIVPLAPGLPSADFSLTDALTAGDDYELCFTAPASSRAGIEAKSEHAGLPKLTRIGNVAAGPAELLLKIDGEPPRPVGEILKHIGFQHFSSAAGDCDEQKA